MCRYYKIQKVCRKIHRCDVRLLCMSVCKNCKNECVYNKVLVSVGHCRR